MDAGECRIAGLGACRPGNVVGNETIADSAGLTPEWIEKRCGVRSRRFAADGEDVESMAVIAAQRALAAAGTAPPDVGLLILVSQTHLKQAPPLAPRVAYRLGLDRAGAFDLKASCAGFCLALATARDFIRSGSARTVLVVAAERISSILDRSDKSTAMIFGDGAASVVVTAAPGAGVGPVIWGSDGSLAESLHTPTNWSAFGADRGLPPPALWMDGTLLVRVILRITPDIVERVLTASRLELRELRAFIPHQANGRIIDMLVSQLDLPAHVAVARDITTAGNTSAASIPLAMHALLADGHARPGDLALLLAYGAGLTYAAQVVELPAACNDLVAA